MITLPRRIVLCGVSGSGKSTLGETLMDRYGYHVTAFADPLKRATQTIFGFKDEHLWGPSVLRETAYPDFVFTGWCFECHVQCQGPERHLATKYRDDPEVLQDALEAYAQVADYWRCPRCDAPYPKYVTVREALRTLGTAWGRKFVGNLWASACFANMASDLPYVVTDCRFTNEVIQARIHQSCVVLLRRRLEESTSSHPSEAEPRELGKTPEKWFDLVLDNREGTPAENYQKLLEQLTALHSSRTAINRIEWHKVAPVEEDEWEFPFVATPTP